MGLTEVKSSETVCEKPVKENICAIIVTYFPDEQFVKRLERINRQVAKTIIVDNTGDGASNSSLRPENFCDVEIIRNKENLGIGAALNQGAARATELGYAWMITFDQDSWVNPNLVQTLIVIYEQQPKPEVVGVIGCNIEDENIPQSDREYDPNGPSFSQIAVVITSGSLMPAAVFRLAGPFRADLFIDFVDSEYCLRLHKIGYKVITSTVPLMVHALGAATQVNLDVGVGRIPFVRSNRPSIRRYYMTRNAILVARQYFSVAPGWVLGSLARILLLAPLKIPFEKTARKKRFCATLYGAIDGLRSRTGKAQAAWLYE